MSALSRVSTDNFEQLILENEKMLAEIDALVPENAQLRKRLQQSEKDCTELKHKVTGLTETNQCLREEGERLRTILGSRHEEDRQHVSNLVATSRETTDQRQKVIEEELYKIRGEIQQVLAMQAETAAANGRSEAATAAAAASAEISRELEAVRAELDSIRSERDGALERIHLIQAQWDASKNEANQLTSERMTLRERAEDMMKSAHVTGASIAGLLADIFDSQEKETADLKTRVAIREMLRNDDAQRHTQEVARLMRSNNELNARLERSLQLLNSGGGAGLLQSPLSQTSGSGTGLPPPPPPPPPAEGGRRDSATQNRRVTQRLTMSFNEEGLITARSQSVDPNNNTLAPSTNSNYPLFQSSPQQQQYSPTPHTPPPAPAPSATVQQQQQAQSPSPRAVQQTSVAAYDHMTPRSTATTSPQQQPQQRSSNVVVEGVTPAATDNSVVKCPRCTFDNPPGARACSVCDMVLVRNHHRPPQTAR